jgi:tol-pal system protein YbgF
MRPTLFALSIWLAVGLFSGGLATPASAQRGGDAIRTEDRFNALERQNAALTGQVEQLQHRIQQLQQQLERMQADYEFRLSQIEGKGGPRPATQATPRPGVTPSTPGVGGPPPGGAPPGPPPIAPQGPIGPQAGMSQPPSMPPPSNAEQLYDTAFSQLQERDYPGAERSFRSFVQSFPRHPFAGTAQFWIGEILFERKDYGAAAAAYAEGYKSYPKSPKGPDNLLQLGRSLALTNRVQDACAIWDKLGRDYPGTSEMVRGHVAEERRRYRCS